MLPTIRSGSLVEQDGADTLGLECAVACGLLSDPAFPVPEDASGGFPVPFRRQTDAEQHKHSQGRSSPDLPGSQTESSSERWWNQVSWSDAVLPFPSATETASWNHPPGLQSRLKRKRSSGTGAAGQSLFDLLAVNKQLAQLVQQEQENCLELPRYTGKVQKREVKTLAALYGLEPRNCGRVGITLFKTDCAALPDQQKQVKIDSLLAKSTATQRTGTPPYTAPKTSRQKAARAKKQLKQQQKQKFKTYGSHHLTQDIKDVTQQTPSTVHVNAPPIDSSNIGSKMLVRLGWEAGTGLGSTLQGQTEPVPIIKRRRHLGLGA